MMLSLDTAYRSFGGEVEASSTPTICRLPDSRRHQLSAIAPDDRIAASFLITSTTSSKTLSAARDLPVLHYFDRPDEVQSRGPLVQIIFPNRHLREVALAFSKARNF